MNLKLVSGWLSVLGYVDVLKNTISPNTPSLSVLDYRTFQEDTSKVTRVLTLSQSPDRMPIAILWNQVATMAQEQKPGKLQELWKWMAEATA